MTCRIARTFRSFARSNGMRAFLDFEASSLAKDSYPIEVGWVFEDGRKESHLIRPAPGWIDWDPRAEALHGISRTLLAAEGEPHEIVAGRMLAALADQPIYVTAPSWDGKWLNVLLRASGLPRHAIRLRDTEEAQYEAAMELLRCAMPTRAAASAAAGRLLAQVRDGATDAKVVHRALADAEAEWQRWQEIRRLASELAHEARLVPHSGAT